MKVKYPKNEIGSLTQEKNKTEKALRNQPSVGAEVRFKKEKSDLYRFHSHNFFLLRARAKSHSSFAIAPFVFPCLGQIGHA